MTPFRISFHVPGDPVPKQRARANPGGKGYYAPRPRGSKRLSYMEYRELVQVQLICALDDQGIRPDYRDRVFPKISWGLTVRAKLGVGDFDNVAGSVADACQGFLYKDDKQVLEAHQYLERVGPKALRGVDVECWTLDASGGKALERAR